MPRLTMAIAFQQASLGVCETWAAIRGFWVPAIHMCPRGYAGTTILGLAEAPY